MKKSLFTFFVLLLCACLFPLTVFADMGPKAAVTVVVEHPPEELCYLDLLTDRPGDYDNLGEERADLDPELLALLRSCEDEGWYPALSGGTGVPLFGSLTGEKREDGALVFRFSYFGVPNPFRVMLVTESGEVRTSEVLTRQVLQTTVTFDYVSDSWQMPGSWRLYLRQFLSTCIPTLLIEVLLLLAFRFPLKRNLLPVILMNLCTQIFLTATLGRQIIVSGPAFYYFMLALAELLIFAAECIGYAFLLKGQPRKRRVAYALTANACSMAAGIAVIELAGKALYSL